MRYPPIGICYCHTCSCSGCPQCVEPNELDEMNDDLVLDLEVAEEPFDPDYDLAPPEDAHA